MRRISAGSISLLLLLTFAALAPAGAQAGSAPDTASTLRTWTESSSARGRRDGAALANRSPMRRKFVAGFGGGFVAAFFGPFVASRSPAGGAVAVSAGAAGVVAAAASGTVRLPTETEARIALQDSAYMDAFRRGYAKQLRARRRSAAGLGALVGITTGAATLYALVLTLVYT